MTKSIHNTNDINIININNKYLILILETKNLEELDDKMTLNKIDKEGKRKRK